MKQYYFTGNRQDLLDNGYEDYDDGNYCKQYGTDLVTINLDNRVITYDNDLIDIFDQPLDEFQVDLGDCNDLIAKGLVQIIEIKE